MILQYIENIWQESDAWPGYTEAMRLALNLAGEKQTTLSSWTKLPGLCCQAVGGDSTQALPIASAWYLFFQAAHLMDSVQDQDDPDDWWAETGPPTALSVATGLYFTGCQALNMLDASLQDPITASQIRGGMITRFLEMSSGQHRDLHSQELSLECYWETARAKSGVFFGMACWAGARLASTQAEVLHGFEQFGQQIGLLIQALNDLKDIKALKDGLPGKHLANLRRSLPVIYVLEVSSAQEKTHLLHLISQINQQPESGQEILDLIEHNGGVLYLQTELALKQQTAEQALIKTNCPPPLLSPLLDLLKNLHSPQKQP